MLCEKEMVQKRCFYEWSCRVPLIMRFPDGWKAGTVCDTPVSLIDLLPTFCQLANTQASLPHDGESLISNIDGQHADRHIFAQAHEAVGVPCIMTRHGRYKYNYIHDYDDQLFDLNADPGEWNNLVNDPAHQETATRLRGLTLDRFNPERMAEENLASLYRRRLIRDSMTKHGQTWTHFPEYDARKGASDQYF